MKIYIDADACPVVTQTIEIARVFSIPVVIVCDMAHHFPFETVEVVTVASGADAVDYEILNRLQVGDLVITQDYGLAALVLAKGGFAMNQNGMVYDDKNMDMLLEARYFNAKLRASGERLKGPKKRGREDNEQFVRALESFLKAHTLSNDES